MNKLDLDICQGDSFLINVTILDNGGTPMNLDGYAVRGSIKEYYSSGQIVPLDCQLYNPSGGEMFIRLDAATTSGMPINQLLYDVEAFTDIDTFKVLRGYANINPEVSN